MSDRVAGKPSLAILSLLHWLLDDGDSLVGEFVNPVDEAVDFLVRGGDLALHDPALVLGVGTLYTLRLRV